MGVEPMAYEATTIYLLTNLTEGMSWIFNGF